MLFSAINGGALGFMVGFAFHDAILIRIAGAFVILSFLSVLSDLLHPSRKDAAAPVMKSWWYGIGLTALLLGLGMGEVMAFRLLPHNLMPQGRLAHIHLTLLGFVTLMIIGAMHQLFPSMLHARLHSARLARLTVILVPTGLGLLLVGFLLGRLFIQIPAGVVVMSGLGIYAYNMVRTWQDAHRPRTAAADHLLQATFFLLATTVVGTLIAVNALSDPPAVPVGTLHLIAYTHLALLGFVLQTVMGGLSHFLPLTLATLRVKSNKRRTPYLTELHGLTERWRAIQVAAISLGTMGLSLDAALVWQFSLSSPAVQIVSWSSALSLLVGMGIFVGKVGVMLVRHPHE